MISLDNRCTNSEPGTYNHECGQPAAWIGTHHNGSRQAFCESCRFTGHEARNCVYWVRFHPALTVEHAFDPHWLDESRGVLTYRGEFVAKFEPDVVRDAESFRLFLLSHFTPAEYFAARRTGAQPDAILASKGYLSKTRREILRLRGYPQTQQAWADYEARCDAA